MLASLTGVCLLCPATACRMCEAAALARPCTACTLGRPASSPKRCWQQRAGQATGAHTLPAGASATAGVPAAAGASAAAGPSVAVGASAAAGVPATPGGPPDARGDGGGDGSCSEPTSSASYSSGAAAGSAGAVGHTCRGHARTTRPVCFPCSTCTCTLRAAPSAAPGSGAVATFTRTPPPSLPSHALPPLLDKPATHAYEPGSSGAASRWVPRCTASRSAAACASNSGSPPRSTPRCGSHERSDAGYPSHSTR